MLSKQLLPTILLALSTTACAIIEEDLPAEELSQVKQHATYRASWTRWISEEDGQCSTCGAICPDGQVAVGIECHGDYCDNMRLRCDAFPGLLSDQPENWNWTAWAGRDRMRVRCEDGEWFTGIKCQGNYCDNVSVRCTRSSVGHARSHTSAFYSEEDGPFTPRDGNFLVGVYCSTHHNPHCDDKAYYYSQARPASRDSCRDSCGGRSPGESCFCDSECINYGDCCTDYEPLCR